MKHPASAVDKACAARYISCAATSALKYADIAWIGCFKGLMGEPVDALIDARITCAGQRHFNVSNVESITGALLTPALAEKSGLSRC